MQQQNSFIMPNAELKKRFGLIPAKIGVSFAHKIGVDMTLEDAQFPVAANVVGPRTRTRTSKTSAFYEYGRSKVDGAPFPVKAKPGATVYLEVQDLSNVDPEDAAHIKWACTHPECAGNRFDSKSELIRSHAPNKELIAAAESSPHGQAHVYYGVIEIPGSPGVPGKKDEKGKLVEPPIAPVESTIMLVSDEE